MSWDVRFLQKVLDEENSISKALKPSDGDGKIQAEKGKEDEKEEDEKNAEGKDADGTGNSNECLTACDIIFKEVYEHMIELMTDPFGNYLCQKLMVKCNGSQRRRIVEIMSPKLVNISCDIHGTRAVQKLIGILAKGNSPENEIDLTVVIKSMTGKVVDLIRNLNGNHVVQACLHNLTSEQNQFIFESVAEHCVSVSTHRHGCCVLQRCIDFATPDQRSMLVAQVIKNALVLVQDPFGNYVVQYVLNLKDAKASKAIVNQLKGHYASLSKQKFSSNVIEKFLAMPDPESFECIVREIAAPNSILELLQDGFGNYVIQKALGVHHPVINHLVEQIRPHLQAIRSSPYGKKLTSKILKKFPLDGSVDTSPQTTPETSPKPGPKPGQTS